MKLITTLLVFTILLVAMPNDIAYAYLDPGSGSLIAQILVAGLLGIAVAGRLFWDNILMFLGIKKRSNLDDDEQLDDDE